VAEEDDAVDIVGVVVALVVVVVVVGDAVDDDIDVGVVEELVDGEVAIVVEVDVVVAVVVGVVDIALDEELVDEVAIVAEVDVVVDAHDDATGKPRPQRSPYTPMQYEEVQTPQVATTVLPTGVGVHKKRRQQLHVQTTWDAASCESTNKRTRQACIMECPRCLTVVSKVRDDRSRSDPSRTKSPSLNPFNPWSTHICLQL
jgi:hypothetical protein